MQHTQRTKEQNKFDIYLAVTYFISVKHFFLLLFNCFCLFCNFFQNSFGLVGDSVMLNNVKPSSIISLSNIKRNFEIHMVVYKISAKKKTFPLYNINITKNCK